MKSSFPKRIKYHSKKKMGLKYSEFVFWGRALHKYVNRLVYIHIYEELLSKTQSTTLRLTFETLFLILEWC